MKKKEITRYIPNIITLSRIPMSVVLLFVQSSPVCFWTFYLLCGLSDVLDGEIARRTGTVSHLGERLDTIADIVFVAVWMILFIPVINVGNWLWIWVGLIARQPGKKAVKDNLGMELIDIDWRMMDMPDDNLFALA